MSAGARLEARISLGLPAVFSVGRRLFSHPRFAELYPDYLVSLHWMMRSTVPLLLAAAEASARLDDRLGTTLAAYYRVHAGEEAGHAGWVLDDLETLGHSRDEPFRRRPPVAVAELVGAQYYWINHVHPVALLGHAAIMEGYPPTREVLDGVIQRSGLPRRAFGNLLRHAEIDVGHRADLYALVDSLPLEEWHEELIGLSAFHTIRSGSQAFNELLDRHPFEEQVSDTGLSPTLSA